MTSQPAFLTAINSFLAPLSEAAGRITTSIGEANRRHENARTYERLLAGDDHVLRDIGVTRGEVAEALRRCRKGD